MLSCVFYSEIQKKLLKLGKEKGCAIIGRWRKACVAHFYWSVISTPAHLGEVKLAKCMSFIYHVINKHKELHNKLFNACHHGLITNPKVWMTKGMFSIMSLKLRLLSSFQIIKMANDKMMIKQKQCVYMDGIILSTFVNLSFPDNVRRDYMHIHK
jgi:hypothetical protein